MSVKIDTSKLNPDQIPPLPRQGLKRASEILPHLPIKKSTLWKWAGNGRFPSPIRINGITVWNCEDIWAWLESHGQTELPAAANDVGSK